MEVTKVEKEMNVEELLKEIEKDEHYAELLIEEMMN